MTLERAVFVSVALVGAALTVGALAIAPKAASSIALAVGIALANLWALKGIVSVLVRAAAGGRAPPGFAIVLVLKLFALFGVVWLLLSRGIMSAGPFAIGYAALPIGVAMGALVCDKARS